MSSEFTQIKIDFQVVDTDDPRYLFIADTSDWGGLEDEEVTLDIIVPGVQGPVTHFFDKYSINRYNSLLLGLTHVGEGGEFPETDLPDGIYEVILNGLEEHQFKRRVILRTTLLEIELDKLYINNVNECLDLEECFMKRIFEIEVILRASHANIRDGNECKAKELFDRARYLIDDLNGCRI